MKATDFERYIRAIYSLWNEERRDELDDLFRTLGPNGFTIEYVGAPPLDGPQAMIEMWRQYGGRTRTEAIEVFVNGDEAAALIANHVTTNAAVMTVPSIELYRIDQGVLSIRYFHRTPAGLG